MSTNKAVVFAFRSIFAKIVCLSQKLPIIFARPALLGFFLNYTFFKIIFAKAFLFLIQLRIFIKPESNKALINLFKAD